MLTEQLIACFLAVVRLGSFTKAGEELFLTQQAVSKHVRKLEQVLNTELLVRTTRNVHPTEQGELYYQMFLKWKAEFEKLQEVTGGSGNHRRLMKIGILKYMINGYVPAIIAQMKQEYPDVQIQITHADGVDLYRMLQDNDIDLAITYDSFWKDEKEVNTEVFGHTGLLLMLAKSHPLAKKSSLDFSDLEDENFLAVLNKGESKSQAMKEALQTRAEFGLGNGPIRLFEKMAEATLMAEYGEGFTFCADTGIFAHNPLARYYPLPYAETVIGAWKKHNNNPTLYDFMDRIEGVAGSKDKLITFEIETQ